MRDDINRFCKITVEINRLNEMIEKSRNEYYNYEYELNCLNELQTEFIDLFNKLKR